MNKAEFIKAYLGASEEVKELFSALLALDQAERARVVPIVREWLLSEEKSEEALREALGI